MLAALVKILLVAAILLAAPIAKETEGQFVEWCVADEQTLDGDLKKALDWACGEGGADCTPIQVNHSCYSPDTLKDHASFAFNNYYQKFKHRGGSCYFNAAAMITDIDPSHGSCKFEYLP